MPMKLEHVKIQIAVLFMLLGWPVYLFAQAGKCEIVGKVMDENQLPVAIYLEDCADRSRI